MRRFRLRLSLWAVFALVIAAGAVSHGVSASATSCTGDPESYCALVFSAQPGNALLNTNITSNGFDSSGAPVAVEAEETDGGPAPGVTVTLSLLPTGSGATLSGTLSGTTDSNGLATFAPLSINQTGYFQLQVAATGFPSTASSGFQITSTDQVCSANPCSTSSSGTSSAASATAINEQSGDVLSLGLGGFSYTCNDSAQHNYQSVSQPSGTDVWQSSGNTIDTNANGQVTIEIFKAAAQKSPNKGAAHFQICYASTVLFAPLSGTSVLTTTAPGGVNLFYGLLPDCGHGHSSPCILSRHKDNAGDVIIVFDGTGDFWGQG